MISINNNLTLKKMLVKKYLFKYICEMNQKFNVIKNKAKEYIKNLAFKFYYNHKHMNNLK